MSMSAAKLRTTDLSMLAADLAIGLIASGQEKKSEEQDLVCKKQVFNQQF